jgi:hypothetical protein
MTSTPHHRALSVMARARILAIAATFATSAAGHPSSSIATTVGVAGLVSLGSCGGEESRCQSYRGSCTGFGTQQCVTAPVAIAPDAPTTTTCCGGWFQYPSIEVCPGKPPASGCGVCAW